MGKYLIVDGSYCYGSAEIAWPLAIVSSFLNSGSSLLASWGSLGEGDEQGISSYIKNPVNSYLPLADTGMGALTRLFVCGRLNNRNFRDYTVPLIRNRLDYAAGHKETEVSDTAHAKHINREIWRVAEACYDRIYLLGMSLIEALAGAGQGDVVVVVLRQNGTVLERFFRLLEHIGARAKYSLVAVLQNYDALSSLSIRNIKRRYGKEIPIVGIPYSTNFSNAWNQAELLSYVQRNLSAGGKSHPEYPVINGLRHLDRCCNELSSKWGFPARDAEVFS